MLKFFKVATEEEYNEIGENIGENEDNEEVGQIAIDIIETKDEMIIVAPVAGIDIDDIDLQFENNVLVISGERRLPLVYGVNAVIRNSECFWGNFSRNIILPENLDFDSIRASMDNCILTITIAKLKFANQRINIEKV